MKFRALGAAYAPRLSRRELLARLAVAGTAGIMVGGPWAAAAEPPPETSRIRMIKVPGICTAPQYVAEELLRAEGFSEVQYVPREGAAAISPGLAAAEIDLNLRFAAPLIIQVDQGDPVVMLAGAHVGCFELIANDSVWSIRDLRGKRVAINDFGLTQHVFLASMVAYVGMHPRKDVNFVAHPPAEAKRLLAEGKVDAYLGFPPDPQELRAKKIGHVVVNSSVDRPRSQYFCCMVAANREFVRKHPVATKRALRAILKSVNVCAVHPAGVARTLVDRGSRRTSTTRRTPLKPSRTGSGTTTARPTRCVSMRSGSRRPG
jgi:NitT/TauT family transport system substrate-binding protein